jgi:hypothetical protein
MTAGAGAPQTLRAVATTWPFVVSVLAMVINDSWLKGAFPGGLSGKLSDFAGVAVVSFLLLAVQPGRPRLVFVMVFLGFAWWKSPWSQPFIDAANAVLPLPIGRTVDYTDLLAVSIIPFCIPVVANPSSFEIPGPNLRRILLAPIVVLTTLGLMATSLLRVQQDYQIRRPASSGQLDREPVAEMISRVAKVHGLECSQCGDLLNSGAYVRGHTLSLEYSFVGDRAVSFKVWASADGMFSDESLEDAERIRGDLKKRLAQLYGDLEYVEALGAR